MGTQKRSCNRSNFFQRHLRKYDKTRLNDRISPREILLTGGLINKFSDRAVFGENRLGKGDPRRAFPHQIGVGICRLDFQKKTEGR